MQHAQQAHPLHGHPKVPDFAAMTSSGAFPVLQVSPDQALNPKSASQANSNQNRTPFVINEVSPNSQQTPPANQQGAAQGQQQKTNAAQPTQPQQTSTKPLPKPVELDRVAVDNVFKSLSNPETGLLTHSSFLFFLVREFTRYQGNGEPFSLIIMELNVLISGSVGGKLPRPLPPRGVRAAAERICSITRPLDLLTHYDQSEYAILLPATSRQQSAEFAIGVGKALLSKPLLPDMEPKSLVVHMGVASFPEDTSHPGILLAAASEAKSTAQIAGKPIILFSET
jgi:GGDEF domain-containing protein